MPWQQRDIIHFCIIILCVPVQYYLSGYFSVKDNDRSQIIMSTMQGIQSIVDNVSSAEFWALKWQQLSYWIFADIINIQETTDGEEESPDTGPVKDTDDMLVKILKVRDKRPDDLLFRVGEVVQHTDHAYRGVIVGWEYSPEDIDEPVYTILIDEPHLKTGLLSSTMEIQQSKIYAIRNRDISHRHLKRYFASFDGSQYLPLEWLKEIYPSD